MNSNRKTFQIIICLLVLFSSSLCLAQQTEVTLPNLDKRFVTRAANGTYSGPTADVNAVGVELNQGQKVFYRTSCTWDMSPITDWSFLNSGIIGVAIGLHPESSFTMEMRNMASRPESQSAASLYSDCAEGTIYETYTISTSGGGGNRDLSAYYLNYLEDRTKEDWCAAGFRSSTESYDTQTFCQLDLATLKVMQEIRMSSSGTLAQDERWGGTHTLTGDVSIPAGVELTIWENATINLNGHSLVVNGGTLAKLSSTTFNPDIRLTDGNTLKGQYPTTETALADADGGDEVDLHTNTTWNNNFTITHNVKVNAGATLTIPGGKTFEFNNGCKLRVKGSLDAIGSRHNEITFKAAPGQDWAGIWVENGGGAGLERCNIYNASYGIYVGTNSTSDFRECEFKNNNFGIYTCASPYGYWSELNVTQNSTAGIRTYNTDFILCYSQIKRSPDGIQTQTCSPEIYVNQIRDNYDRGCLFGAGGAVDMGEPYVGGYNAIYDNDGYELWVVEGTHVHAVSNYWGPTEPGEDPEIPWDDIYMASGGSVLAWNPLEDDPTTAHTGQNAENDRNGTNNLITNLTPEEIQVDPMALVYQAIGERKQDQYGAAQNQFEQVIQNHPQSEAAIIALWELEKTHIRAQYKGFKSQLNGDLALFLNSVINTHSRGQKDAREALYQIALKQLVGVHRRAKNFKRMITYCNRLISEYPQSHYEEESLWDLFNLQHEVFEDSAQAKPIFAELEQKYPESMFIVHGKIALGIDIEKKPILNKNSAPENHAAKNKKPEFCQLHQNYPNPFNPTTAISYALPEAAFVTLKIYNLQGKQVRTLVKSRQTANQHQVVWDSKDDNGKPVAAGVYLYRLEAGNFTNTKRLILLK